MDRENIKRVIDVMKEKKYGFYMNKTVALGKEHIEYALSYAYMTEEEANICGIVASIVGHCCLAFNCLSKYNSRERAQDILGLSDRQVNMLFSPMNRYASYQATTRNKKFITRARAVKVLENLLETSLIDWRIGYIS